MLKIRCEKYYPKKETMERNLSSSIVQQSTWVLLLGISAKSVAQFSKPAPFGEELKGSKKREKKVRRVITQIESL